MDWFEIITELVMPILCTLVTVFVLPMIRDKRIKGMAEELVAAAEQIYPAGSGPDKYAYVRRQLVKLFGLSDEKAQIYIEAAVYALNAAAAAVRKE